MLGDRRGLGLGLADDRSARSCSTAGGRTALGSGTAFEAHQQPVGIAADPGLRVGAQIEDHASHRIGRRAVLSRADALDLACSHGERRVGPALHRAFEVDHEAGRVLELEALEGELAVALDPHQSRAVELDHFDALKVRRRLAHWRGCDVRLLRVALGTGENGTPSIATSDGPALTTSQPKASQRKRLPRRRSPAAASRRLVSGFLGCPMLTPPTRLSRYEGLSCLITSRNGLAAVGSRTSCLKTTSATSPRSKRMATTEPS